MNWNFTLFAILLVTVLYLAAKQELAAWVQQIVIAPPGEKQGGAEKGGSTGGGKTYAPPATIDPEKMWNEFMKSGGVL